MEMYKSINERYKKWMTCAVFGVSFLGIFLLTAFYTGSVPGITISSLGINYGLAVSPEYSPFFRGDICYPYGAESNQGFCVKIIAWLFSITGMSTEFAWSMTNFVLFAFSFASAYALFYLIGKNRWVPFIGILLLYMNPFVVTHESIYAIYFGIIYIPFCILMELFLWKYVYNNDASRGKKFIYFSVILFARLFLVSLGWYTAVIMAMGSCLFWLFQSFTDIKKKKLPALVGYYLEYVLLPWIIAMAVFMLLTPSETSSFGSDLTFINGQSVDLITLFLPGNSQLIGKLGISFNDFLPDGRNLTGDGNTWKNYLGWTMILSVLVIAVKYRKKIARQWYMIGAVFLIVLVISLGPAVKFLETADKGSSGMYQSYLLSFEGMIKLPLYWIYRLFPFTIMRANYRWIALPIILLITAFVKVLSKLCHGTSKMRIFALILALLALIEYYPATGISGTVSGKEKNYATLQQQNEDIIAEIRENVPEDSKVVMCTYDYSSNAYLLPYITTKCNILSYTGMGDKALALAELYIPDAVKNLQTESDPKQLAEYCAEVLEKQICDYVILPFYSLRDNSYGWSTWPPSASIIGHTYGIAEETASYLSANYAVVEGKQHMFISKASKSEKYELLNSELSKLPSSLEDDRLFNTKTSHLLDVNEQFTVFQDIEEGKNSLYLQTYLKSGGESNISAYIRQYNGNELAGEEIISIPVNSSYELFEMDYNLKANITKIEFEVINTTGEELYIKNIIVQPYDSGYTEKIFLTELSEEYDFWQEESVHLTPDISVEISGIDEPVLDELNINLEFRDEKWDTTESYPIVSMMKSWANDMTVYIGAKEQYYFVACSNDGTTVKSIWLDKTLFLPEEWNGLKVSFKNGMCKIYINGNLYKAENFEFESLFAGNYPFIIGGSGFQGDVQNIGISFD